MIADKEKLIALRQLGMLRAGHFDKLSARKPGGEIG